MNILLTLQEKHTAQLKWDNWPEEVDRLSAVVVPQVQETIEDMKLEQSVEQPEGLDAVLVGFDNVSEVLLGSGPGAAANTVEEPHVNPSTVPEEAVVASCKPGSD